MSEQGKGIPGVSAARARIAVQRLINSHFRNDNRARCSIPANRENDDDLVAMDYVTQSEERIARSEQALAALEAENAEWDVMCGKLHGEIQDLKKQLAKAIRRAVP